MITSHLKLKVFLIIVLFPNSLLAQANMSVHSESELFQGTISYDVETYVFLRIDQAKQFLEEKLEGSSKIQTLKHLIQEAEQGDQETKLFLSYIYLYQWIKTKRPELQNHPFYKDSIPWDEEIQNKIHSSLFRHSVDLLSFIEALKSYFKMFHTPNDQPEKIKEYRESSLKLLFPSKPNDNKDTEFLWAFMVLSYHYSNIEINLGKPFYDIQEAKNSIVKLAESDHIASQEILGVINMRENNTKEAIYWLAKAYNNGSTLYSSIFLSILYKYMEKDLFLARSFMEHAFYREGVEGLRLELLNTYLLDNNISDALKLAMETVEAISKVNIKYKPEVVSPILTLTGLLMNKKNGKTGDIYENSLLHIIENLLGRLGVRNLTPRIGVPTNIFVRSDRNHFLHQPLSGEQIRAAQRKAIQDLAFIISQPNLNEKCEKVFH